MPGRWSWEALGADLQWEHAAGPLAVCRRVGPRGKRLIIALARLVGGWTLWLRSPSKRCMRTPLRPISAPDRPPLATRHAQCYACRAAPASATMRGGGTAATRRVRPRGQTSGRTASASVPVVPRCCGPALARGSSRDPLLPAQAWGLLFARNAFTACRTRSHIPQQQARRPPSLPSPWLAGQRRDDAATVWKCGGDCPRATEVCENQAPGATELCRHPDEPSAARVCRGGGWHRGAGVSSRHPTATVRVVAQQSADEVGRLGGKMPSCSRRTTVEARYAGELAPNPARCAAAGDSVTFTGSWASSTLHWTADSVASLEI